MIFERARDLLLAEGFSEVGGVDWESARALYHSHATRYQEWLSRGYSANMGYLERRAQERMNPELYFPEFKSILSALWFYPATTVPTESVPRQARYLQGPDYHDRLKQKLRTVADVLANEFEVKAIPVVDTSPVLERSWAEICGLGWIGKNTLLIHPKRGSYSFIGSILLDREIGRGPMPHPSYCGECTRCLDGCPTRAFAGPGWLNAKKCISYQTLEHRAFVPEEVAKKSGSWVAGCDVCQEVCPFNRKAMKANETPLEAIDWETLLGESEVVYRLRAKQSAISRVKPWMMSRNTAIALRNSFLELSPDRRKRVWPRIESRLKSEQNEIARAEWRRTVEFCQSFLS